MKMAYFMSWKTFPWFYMYYKANLISYDIIMFVVSIASDAPGEQSSCALNNRSPTNSTPINMASLSIGQISRDYYLPVSPPPAYSPPRYSEQ